MGLGLTANPEVGEGSCTGFTTGLLTSGVTPVKIDEHFQWSMWGCSQRPEEFFSCNLSISFSP